MVRIERIHNEAGPKTQKSKRMATIRENSIPNHRPKTIWIKTNKEGMETRKQRRKCEKNELERRKITENKEIFRELHTRSDEKKTDVTNLDWIANILKCVV